MAQVYRHNDSWWIDCNVNGKRRRFKAGPNHRIATEMLNDLVGKLARREYIGAFDDSDISFADFAEEWWSRVAYTLRPSTRERWRGIVDLHLKPAFAGRLRNLTPARVEAYLAQRAESGAKGWTLVHECKVLVHMVRRAVRWEFLGKSPIHDAQGKLQVKLPRVSHRTRFLTHDEITRLLAECRAPHLHAFVLVSLNTGMRRSELLSLSRATVDLDAGIGRLSQTKNGKPRTVFLNAAAVAALRSLPAGEKFFPQSPYAISASLRRALRRAKIADARLHDLRHTTASHAAMAGIGQRGVMALLGHADYRSSLRYQHLSDSYLREVTDALTFGQKIKTE
jgi:integrase